MWNRKGARGQQLTIIGWGWAKYRDLSVASRSIIANNWSMRLTNHNICNNRVQLSFSQWVCFFNEYLVTQNWSQEGEKHGFIYAWAECYL